MGTHPATLQRC